MVWLAVELLPQWSVAVQVRVTLLACGHEPGVVTSAKVSVGLGSHASVAVGVANDGVAGHSMVVGPGTAEMLGACVSTTLMVWLAVELLPQSSVAVQVRVTLLDRRRVVVGLRARARRSHVREGQRRTRIARISGRRRRKRRRRRTLNGRRSRHGRDARRVRVHHVDGLARRRAVAAVVGRRPGPRYALRSEARRGWLAGTSQA